ncbi:right-handed parallel beta-helix repeat-containing protein [Halosimplex salinum]|uniref:right-handed parallel beta-helix repeat-containing protein n=1 Tax=Halosimplex salinum TaxID=1710538 RepID=UPI000F492DD1|nr:right-handed parallel beta-helix repeat-containing protein [Halosimplex salinum]
MTDDTDPDETGAAGSGGLRRRNVLIGALAATGLFGATAFQSRRSETARNVDPGDATGEATQSPTARASPEPTRATDGGTELTRGLQAEFYEGTLEERPPAGSRGRYWRVHDPETPEHGVVYVDDGDSWSKVDVGFGSVDVGEQNGTVQWVRSGSDSAAIQAAIDDVADSGGGIVKLEQGEFTISNDVTCRSGVVVEGAGIGESTLRAQGGYGLQSEPDISRAGMREFTYDGQNSGDGAWIFWVGGSEGPTYCFADHVEVRNAGARSSGSSNGGLAIRGGHDNTLVNCRAENCAAVSLGAPLGERSTIAFCEVKDANPSSTFNHGLSVEDAHHSVVIGNHCYDTDRPLQDPAININRTSRTVCLGNTVSQTYKGINMANGRTRETVVGFNTIHDVANKGIIVSVTNTGPLSVENNLVIGNVVRGWEIYGLQVNNDAHADIKFNTFISENASSSRGNKGSAVFIFDPGKGCDVVGNRIHASQGTGITHGPVDEDEDEKRYPILANNRVEAPNGRSIEVAADETRILDNYVRDGNTVVRGANGVVVRDTGPATVNTVNGVDRLVVDGRYRVPPTFSLGGSDGTIAPESDPVGSYDLLVEAGGSPAALQGIEPMGDRRVTARIVRAGDERVVLEHDSDDASCPLLNRSGRSDALDSNGALATYEFDSRHTVWRQTALNRQ